MPFPRLFKLNYCGFAPCLAVAFPPVWHQHFIVLFPSAFARAPDVKKAIAYCEEGAQMLVNARFRGYVAIHGGGPSSANSDFSRSLKFVLFLSPSFVV